MARDDGGGSGGEEVVGGGGAMGRMMVGVTLVFVLAHYFFSRNLRVAYSYPNMGVSK